MTKHIKVYNYVKNLAAKAQIDGHKGKFMTQEYHAARQLCLECELLTFKELERAEYQAKKDLIIN